MTAFFDIALKYKSLALFWVGHKKFFLVGEIFKQTNQFISFNALVSLVRLLTILRILSVEKISFTSGSKKKLMFFLQDILYIYETDCRTD
jgi:hypothetical protein